MRKLCIISMLLSILLFEMKVAFADPTPYPRIPGFPPISIVIGFILGLIILFLASRLKANFKGVLKTR
jgi:hypothetical protein